MVDPTILIVDNDEKLLVVIKTRLSLEGYKVFTAKNEQQALEICQREIIHLVVIDIRLVEDKNPEDWSGLHLASKLHDMLGESIYEIILTGAQYKDPGSVPSDTLRPDAQGKKPVKEFVWKRPDVQGPKELYKRIDTAFLNQIRLNRKLDIKFTDRLTWRTLVEQIKMFVGSDDDTWPKAEQVLEDLTCRLFHKNNKVVLSPLTPGQGPCTVVKALPYYEDDETADLVVKFGPKESIDREEKNYRSLVDKFIPDSTRLQEDPVRSRDMGAIAYTLVGGDVNEVSDFCTYYREKDPEKLIKTLEHLFLRSCKKWYKNTRPPKEAEKRPLDVWYREQLNLIDPTRIEKLKGAFNRLINDDLLGQGSISRTNGGIHLKLDECDDTRLPDPIHFALEQNCSASGSDFFPAPSKVAITHGDLHSKNILVDDEGRTWLIDFYKTGLGPALRDFAELESDIKFDLFTTDNLCERYELEKMLLAPEQLNETINLEPTPSDQQARALTVIQRLRKLAYELTGKRDAREYYIALLFYALKRITGFTSSVEDTPANTVVQYHALISAAMICGKLSSCSPGKAGSVFLAHAYRPPWIQRIRVGLKGVIESLNYEVHHPLDGGVEDRLWPGIKSLIEQSNAGFYEITSKNGNVYFELGYAIGHRKPYFPLLDSRQPSRPEIAPLLRGLLMIEYANAKSLRAEVQSLLKDKRHLEKRFFFNDPQFKEAPVNNSRTALLIATDNSDQHKEVTDELLSVIRRFNHWQVEAVDLKHAVDIKQFFSKALHAEVVVGCLSPETDALAKYANAELALAMGIAHGIRDSADRKKTVIILQEEGSDVPTDLKSLVSPFRKTTGAAAALKNELQTRFTERLKNESA